MSSALFAEFAVLLELESVGIVFLVLHALVVSLLALTTNKSDFNSHFGTSIICYLPLTVRLAPPKRHEKKDLPQR